MGWKKKMLSQRTRAAGYAICVIDVNVFVCALVGGGRQREYYYYDIATRC